LGDSVSILVDIKADELANMTPIARMPKSGEAGGWSVQLKEDGGIVFRIGTVDHHTDMIADHIYEPGKLVQLACLFEKGTASIYKNGLLVKKFTGITENIRDTKTAGRVGTVGRDFEAVGDVVMQVGKTDQENKSFKNFRGTMQHLRIYNRIISM